MLSFIDIGFHATNVLIYIVDFSNYVLGHPFGTPIIFTADL